MKVPYTNSSAILLKKWTIVIATVLCFAGCEDNSLTPAEQDIAAFSQQLQGNWTLDKVTINAEPSGTVTIAPVREFACDKVSKAFQTKDVVNKYAITYSDKVLHVMKQYTCRLAPEELSWRIELAEQAIDESTNWMTGKNFKIKEINEGTVTGEFRLLFFNLDNCSPDGKAATSAMKNKLWLEVEYDTKEQATFRLEFSKGN
ncbi:MAG TPA: hypothetical protein VK658_18325 [Chryseolinea sp.]|nr:hypothetical protein [Chryseolinea sp.]